MASSVEGRTGLDRGRAPRTDREVMHPRVAERGTRGKRARGEVPRSSHGVWVPASGRPAPIALLEEQAESRVPELVPLRYGRMLVSPFTFYRGAALIMAADLAATAASAPASDGRLCWPGQRSTGRGCSRWPG